MKKAIEVSKPTPLPRAWRARTFACYYQGKFADSAAAADQYLLLVPDDDDVQQIKKWRNKLPLVVPPDSLR